MADRQIEARITNVVRLRLSKNGNPSYLVNTTEGEFLTGIDAGINYGITNFYNHPEPVVLTLNRHNRIVNVEYKDTANGTS